MSYNNSRYVSVAPGPGKRTRPLNTANSELYCKMMNSWGVWMSNGIKILLLKEGISDVLDKGITLRGRNFRPIWPRRRVRLRRNLRCQKICVKGRVVRHCFEHLVDVGIRGLRIWQPRASRHSPLMIGCKTQACQTRCTLLLIPGDKVVS